MKQARALLDMGRVTSFAYTPPVLTGVVREAETDYRGGLKISSATNVENICRCRASREWGTICAHSLAIGLAVIRAKSPPAAKASAMPRTLVADGPLFSTEPGAEDARLFVVLPPNLKQGWERNQVMVGIEAECGNRRILAHALAARKVYRCGPEDLLLARKVSELNGGKLTGMLLLDREGFLTFLNTIVDHTRVTQGKGTAVKIAREPLRPGPDRPFR